MSFARNPNSPELPEWPRYEEKDRAHIILDRDITVGKDLKQHRVAFWKDIMAKYGSTYTNK